MVKKEEINDNNFVFIDDKTFPNKILYFTFNKYILKGTLNYFSHVQKNVFFIKEEEKLPENILNELKNYEHLVSYTEVNKSDIV